MAAGQDRIGRAEGSSNTSALYRRETTGTLSSAGDPVHRKAFGDPRPEVPVGTAGFEPATSASRTLRATKLRHVPSRPVYRLSVPPSG
jgi:hypothetical protein